MFIPYQIDYGVQNVSKTFGVSKKRITFKFGFANRKAVEEGAVGVQCRGSEHEVVFVWSLSSGKRLVIVDGRENHFSESGMNGWTNDRAFQHQFPLRIPGTGTLRCLLISEPVNNQVPGSRPFDIRVQGVSYFNFCKMYELGTSRMVVREGGSSTPDEEYNMTPEERRVLAAVKLESMKEYRRQQGQPKSQSSAPPPKLEAETAPPKPTQAPLQQETSLLSFDDDPVPPPATTVLTAQRSNPFFSSSVTLDTSIGGPDGFQQQQQQQVSPLNPYNSYNNYSFTPASASGSFSASQLPPQQQPPTVYASSPYPGPQTSTPSQSWALTPYPQQQQQQQSTPAVPTPQGFGGGSGSLATGSFASSGPHDPRSVSSGGAPSSAYGASPYVQQPPPQQQIQQQPGQGYGAQVTQPEWGYSSAPAATTTTTSTTVTATSTEWNYNSSTPVAALPSYSAAVPNSTYGSSSFAASATTAYPNNSGGGGYGYTLPPVATMDQQQPAPGATPTPYGYYPPQQQQQQQQAYSTGYYQQQQQPPPPLISPSNTTIASYGSAPSFAQPPRPNPELSSAYPAFASPPPQQGYPAAY